ncbi:MAG: sortase [Candidatus Pacebacteria bacterium]|nr:sortase [Candidatus Paceibacterota bacterium]
MISASLARLFGIRNITKNMDDLDFNQPALIKLYRQAVMTGDDLEQLEKKISKFLKRSLVSSKLEDQQAKTKATKLKDRLPKPVRWGAAFLPLGLILVGLVLVANATLPIMAYYVNTLPSLKASQLVAPVPQDQVLDINPLIIAQTEVTDHTVLGTKVEDDGPVIIDTELDYTNLNNWFGDQTLPTVEPASEGSLPELAEQPSIAPKIVDYRLDIPEVEISNARVAVGGTDLDKSLIHYPGTALPGQLGSPVIFGHSVLRQFYNPSEKNPRRYNSIFSTIMTLEKGDKIYLTAKGVRYTYVVQDKIEVKPTDTYILAQRYDSRQLKLVTCVPEGTYLRRGVVIAQLIKE